MELRIECIYKIREVTMFFIKNLREENDYLRATRDRDRGIFFVLGLLVGLAAFFAATKVKKTDAKEVLDTVKQYGNDTMTRLSESFDIIKGLVLRKKHEVEDGINEVVSDFEQKLDGEEIFEEEVL